MNENEKFNGDSKLLQDGLRRFCELVKEEVHELPNGTIHERILINIEKK